MRDSSDEATGRRHDAYDIALRQGTWWMRRRIRWTSTHRLCELSLAGDGKGQHTALRARVCGEAGGNSGEQGRGFSQAGKWDPGRRARDRGVEEAVKGAYWLLAASPGALSPTPRLLAREARLESGTRLSRRRFINRSCDRLIWRG